MAKKVGYEVIARRSVCVDFRDGRVVSYRPGQRFVVERTNSSVMRLERVKEVRRLGPMESVPPMPVKLGAPRRVQAVMKARSQVDAARKAALARFEASRQAPPKIEEAKPTPIKKKPKKKTKSATDQSQHEADK